MSPVIHIGVTGTRSGMTSEQKSSVAKFFDLFFVGSWKGRLVTVHHGDCVGADVEFAEIAESYGCLTICHPPLDNSLRAWHNSTEILESKSYFARNRDIVDVSGMLFVIPWQSEWQPKGGTWYTYDYAKKKNKFRFIVWPDGAPKFCSPFVGE